MIHRTLFASAALVLFFTSTWCSAQEIDRKQLFALIDEINLKSQDQAAKNNASQLKRRLGSGTWYFYDMTMSPNNFGQYPTKTVRGSFEGLQTRGGVEYVQISKQLIPIEALTGRELQAITDIQNRLDQLRLDIERMKLAVEKEQKKNFVRTAVFRTETPLVVNNKNEIFPAGTEFEVEAINGNRVKLKIAGGTSEVDLKYVHIIEKEKQGNIFGGTNAGGGIVAKKTPNWQGSLNAQVQALPQKNGTMTFLIIKVTQNGAGASMGLKAGDEIVKIDGSFLTNKNEYLTAMARPIAPVLTVRDRFGNDRQAVFKPAGLAPVKNPQVQKIQGKLNEDGDWVVRYALDEVTQPLNLQNGDKILSVNGHPIGSVADINVGLGKSKDGASSWVIERRNDTMPNEEKLRH